MILETLGHRYTIVDRLDPRVRTVCAIAAALFPLFLSDLRVLLVTLGLVLAFVLYERPDLGALGKRMLAVNVFMATLVLLLPWSVPGETLFAVGGLTYSREGLLQALAILLKGNAIVLAITALLGTLEPVRFAHALERLKVPSKLILLYLFTVRYIAVLEEEYGQLRRAMAIRAFRPRPDLHTLRSMGYLVGMLLVRALDRSERIQKAMKCRGFAGRFHTHEHFRVGRLDGVFALGLAFVMAGLLVVNFV